MGTFIPDNKLREIDSAKERIDSRRIEDYVNLMHRGMMSEVANNTSKIDEDNARRKIEVVKNFKSSWEFASNKFNGVIEKGILQDIAGRLEPALCLEGRSYAPIRKGMARLEIDGITYLSPSDEKRILTHMERMFEVGDMHHFHPIEEAFYYNLHLTRIQMFDNANKRLSNIVMNLILKNNDYFPISVKSEDKAKFKNLVGKAIRGFQEISSNVDEEDYLIPYLLPDQAQRELFGYLANRELHELRMAEDHLKGLPSYVINFDHVKERGMLFSAKKMVGNWFTSHNVPYQIKLKPNEHNMEVIGRISQNTLYDTLSRLPGKLRIDIKTNGLH